MSTQPLGMDGTCMNSAPVMCSEVENIAWQQRCDAERQQADLRAYVRQACSAASRVCKRLGHAQLQEQAHRSLEAVISSSSCRLEAARELEGRRCHRPLCIFCRRSWHRVADGLLSELPQLVSCVLSCITVRLSVWHSSGGERVQQRTGVACSICAGK